MPHHCVRSRPGCSRVNRAGPLTKQRFVEMKYESKRETRNLPIDFSPLQSSPLVERSLPDQNTVHGKRKSGHKGSAIEAEPPDGVANFAWLAHPL
jgi:hypothetical protein